VSKKAGEADAAFYARALRERFGLFIVRGSLRDNDDDDDDDAGSPR